MSLKRELQDMDAVELARQAFAYDAKIESLAGNPAALEQETVPMMDEYPGVNVLLHAVVEVFVAKGLPTEDLKNIAVGASYVLSVLTEFAEVQDMPPTSI